MNPQGDTASLAYVIWPVQLNHRRRESGKKAEGYTVCMNVCVIPFVNGRGLSVELLR